MSRVDDTLRHRQGVNLIPLPNWATYLVALGRLAVENSTPGRRLVIGVSLPTRAFAAAFSALGVAAASGIPQSQDARQHFDWLASHPSGTPIRFRRGSYLYSAHLIGVEVRQGRDYLTYQDKSKCYRPWERCLDIQPLAPGERFVRRRPLAHNASFVEAVLGIDPLAHAAQTHVDCVIVGIKESLRSEMVDAQFFAAIDDGSYQAGVLNDLLRCDAFELNANDHDRTAILSPLSSEVPERLKNSTPSAVIFDGPVAYLRLRSSWRRSPSIVLLDRSSASVQAAGDAFNQELALSAEDADLSPIGDPPETLEVRGFWAVAR